MKSIDQENTELLARIMRTPTSKQLDYNEHTKSFKQHQKIKKSMTRTQRSQINKLSNQNSKKKYDLNENSRLTYQEGSYVSLNQESSPNLQAKKNSIESADDMVIIDDNEHQAVI